MVASIVAGQVTNGRLYLVRSDHSAIDMGDVSSPGSGFSSAYVDEAGNLVMVRPSGAEVVAGPAPLVSGVVVSETGSLFLLGFNGSMEDCGVVLGED